MAAPGLVAAMKPRAGRELHPFFKVPQHQDQTLDAPKTSAEPNGIEDENTPASGTGGQKSRKKRPQVSKSSNAAQRGLMAAFTGKTKNGQAHTSERDLTLEVDPNLERRKRRRTESLERDQQDQHGNSEDGSTFKLTAAMKPSNVLENSRVSEDSNEANVEESNNETWREQLEAEARLGPNSFDETSNTPVCTPEKSPVRIHSGRTPKRLVLCPSSSPPPSSDPSASRYTTNLEHGAAEEVPHTTNLMPAAASGGQPDQSEPSGQRHDPSLAAGACRKMLRLNASGRFSSPPSKAPIAVKDGASHEKPKLKKPKRGAKRNLELIVAIPYSTNPSRSESLGFQISEILAGRSKYPTAVPKIHSKAAVTPTPTMPRGPPKPMHPFFLGKDADLPATGDLIADTSSPAAIKSPRMGAVTLGKLMAQRKAHAASSNTLESSSALLASHRRTGLPKLPGARDASWPWQGLSHVRGLLDQDGDVSFPQGSDSESYLNATRKRKHITTLLAADEELHSVLAAQLFASRPGTPKDVLRRPQRLLTTGDQLQTLLIEQIGASRRQVLEREPFRSIFEGILNNLTPFDLFQCESQAWTQKYAPKSGAQVLQSSKEVTALRDWLRALTVNSTASTSQKVVKSEESRKRPKKRRKLKDMDNFVVSDVSGDEGAASFDELSDVECDTLSPGSRGGKKSLVRRACATYKLANVVVLSGSSGSGKSAAVYAVAKELGFEVFEINSGSRRSGKDVMDKVGDMAENHLVQQEVARQLSTAADDGNVLTSEPDKIKENVDAGRQSTMASFFQASAAKPNAQIKTARPRSAKNEESKPLPPKRRNQKQSLILCEEVDVLFEEDQGFWATIRALAMHSKRPVVLTCNDEALVRIEDHLLHAILRFAPAPLDIAVDHLLLIAASEGHVLQRSAMELLYEYKKHDLRASIAELDFWCQMAVGDQKGGLEWVFQRWPPGSDVDDQGRTLRVGSQDTYCNGMGVVPRDILLDQDHIGFHVGEELALFKWGDSDIDKDIPWLPHESHPHDSDDFTSRSQQLNALSRMEKVTELFSAVDNFCHGSFSSLHHSTLRLHLDTSVPALSDKSLQSYAEGQKVLQAEPLSDFLQSESKLATYFYSHGLVDNVYASHSGPSLDQDEVFLSQNIPKPCEPVPGLASIVLPLEPLACTHATSSSTTGATLTSLDRPLSIIAAEIAPYIRSIVAYDMRLEADRLRLGSILTGTWTGSRGKLRKTRTARSALEGGKRENTRREKWFTGAAELDQEAVMKTAGKAWAGLGVKDVAERGRASGMSGLKSNHARSVSAEAVKNCN